MSEATRPGVLTVRALLVLLVACSSPQPQPQPIPKPTSVDAAVDESTADANCEQWSVDEILKRDPLTKEQCECNGGRVNGSMGGGNQAHCAAGETELARVRLGIEGGWCCRK